MFGNPPLFQGHVLVVNTSVLGGIVAIHVGLLGLLASRYDAFIRELLYYVCVLMGLGVYQCLSSHHISHHPSVSTHTILSTSHVFFLRISHQKINPLIPRSTVIITHHKNPKKMVALSSLKK